MHFLHMKKGRLGATSIILTQIYNIFLPNANAFNGN